MRLNDVTHNDRRRRRMAYARRLEGRKERNKRAWAVRMLLLALSMALMFALSVAGTGSANPQTQSACAAAMTWPLAQVETIQDFDGPDKPWLPGHRGVDLVAGEGTEILSPADGVVSFAGTVAGKRVVSVQHGLTTSSFEPAATDLNIGASVARGQPFATVSQGSDHCDGTCLHWGVRRGKNDYLDPAAQVVNRVIALKPVG